MDLVHHFLKHGGKFPATDAQHYQSLADAFLGAPKARNVFECTRKNGDFIRYNQLTEEYGVLRKDRFIETYYKADVLIHRQPNNLEYFRKECRK